MGRLARGKRYNWGRADPVQASSRSIRIWCGGAEEVPEPYHVGRAVYGPGPFWRVATLEDGPCDAWGVGSCAGDGGGGPAVLPGAVLRRG
eukprot:638208-Pyramimonas_sp.AAC.1